MTETTIPMIALALSVVSIVFTAVTFFWTVRRDKKQATLDAYLRLQNESFDPLNLLAPAEIRRIAASPTSADYKKVSGYIARIEHFCVGVNTDIYDKDVVYELAHGYLDAPVILSRIEPIIEKKLRRADQDYYRNIHEVLRWMKQKSGETA